MKNPESEILNRGWCVSGVLESESKPSAGPLTGYHSADFRVCCIESGSLGCLAR